MVKLYPDGRIFRENGGRFREEFVNYLDYKIFLDISFQESLNRAKYRDVPLYGSTILTKYYKKHHPTHQEYLEHFPPENIADLIIEQRLKKYGMNIVRSRSSTIVNGLKGPLEENMGETFRNIGVEIAKFI